MAEPSTSAEPSTGGAKPETAATPAAATQTTPAQASEAPPDYANLLAAIPDDLLLKDNRVNGLVGKHVQRQTAATRAQWEADADRKARDAKEQELIALAESSPFEFQQRFLKEKAQERVQREFRDVERKVESQLAQRLGSAYQGLTPDELATVTQRAKAAIDRGENELVAFHTAAVDVIAEKRATARTEAELSKRLASEKEAWTKESQANRLKGEAVPDLMGARGAPGGLDPGRMTDKEFDQWYAQNMLR